MLAFVNHPPLDTPDGGPYYAETDFSRFIVEPWNAVSSLAFLVPVVYWAWRLRGLYREYPFLVFAMPLLALGGLGSTFFHAFRASSWLLLMDVVPILLLTVAVAIYFWWKVLPHWSYVVVVLGVYFGGWLWLMRYGPFVGQARINANYFLRGVMLFMPGLLLQFRSRYLGLRDILLATGLFVVALLFRRSDVPLSWMPMGTHWLWHVCCALGAHFLARYLYQINRMRFGVRSERT
ncbi:MAG: hypothetical protein WBA12_13935 [Catalinimonas sp.]